MNDPRFLRVPHNLRAAMERAGVRDAVRDRQGQAPRAARRGARARSARHLALGRAGPRATIPGRRRGQSRSSSVAPNAGDLRAGTSPTTRWRSASRSTRAWTRTLMYVSLTDYVQHKEAPGGADGGSRSTPLRRAARRVPRRGLRLRAHRGPRDERQDRADGSPDVRYLDDVLRGAGIEACRCVLPITDPYVVHHGALGSFARVYVLGRRVRPCAGRVAACAGIEAVLHPRRGRGDLRATPRSHRRPGGARRPLRRCWARAAATTISRRSGRGLRSHGGLHEAVVPMVVCHPLGRAARERMERGESGNADVFDLVLNGLVEGGAE